MQVIDRIRKQELVGLAVFLLGCYSVAGLASLVTSPEIAGWYAALRKPSWTPPNWVFGPVWSLLYAAMAVAGWLVWRRVGWRGGRRAIVLFVVQLALNLTWSFIFFGLHRPGLALVEILGLWGAIAATMLGFGRVSTPAALLLVPYLLWVAFAAALNLAVWRLNG